MVESKRSEYSSMAYGSLLWPWPYFLRCVCAPVFMVVFFFFDNMFYAKNNERSSVEKGLERAKK